MPAGRFRLLFFSLALLLFSFGSTASWDVWDDEPELAPGVEWVSSVAFSIVEPVGAIAVPRHDRDPRPVLPDVELDRRPRLQ